MHPYQSSWMAHWMQQRNNLALPDHKHVALSYESKEHVALDGLPLAQIAENRNLATSPLHEVSCAPENRNMWGYQQDHLVVASAVPESDTAIRAITFTNQTLVMSSKSLTNIRPELHPFPMLNFNQKIASILGPRNDVAFTDKFSISRLQSNDNFDDGKTFAGTSQPCFPSRNLRITSNETELPQEKEYCSQPEEILHAPRLPEIPYTPLESTRLLESRSCDEDLIGSNFNLVEHGFKPEGLAVPPIICRNKEAASSRSYSQSKDYFIKANHTDKEQHSGWTDASKKLPDSSKRHLHFPISVEEQVKRMKVSPGSGFVPGLQNPPGVKKMEDSNHGGCSLFRMPTAPDVETMRSCTKVDCADGVPGLRGGPSKLTQTTHHLLITKRTDVNLSEEDQVTRKSSTISASSRGNTLTELLGLLPDFEYHVEHRLMLSSKDGEVREGVKYQTGGFLGEKNHTSADTNFMESNMFQKRNYFLGRDSSPLDKDVKVGETPVTAQATVSSSTEIARRRPETKLPDDVNQKSPSYLTSHNATTNMYSSTSRTDSMEMEHLSQAVHLNNLSPSNQPKSTPTTLEPRNKNMNYCRRTTTEQDQTPDKHHNRKKLDMGKIQMPSKSSREPSSTGEHKDQRDIAFSQPWVQRWCQNVAVAPSSIESSTTVGDEQLLQSSVAAMDALERQQLPSIAAMALMGKAMNGFQECEFKNKGSYVVWSSGEV